MNFLDNYHAVYLMAAEKIIYVLNYICLLL